MLLLYACMHSQRRKVMIGDTGLYLLKAAERLLLLLLAP